MIVELTVKDLAERLGVKPDTIRSYDNKNILNDKLEIIDGRIIDKRKVGRSNVYIVEVIEKDTLDSICKKNRIKSKEKLKMHTIMRKEIIEGISDFYTQYEMANKLRCSRDLVRKMDDILIREEFMKKDSYVYFRWESGERTEVSEEEYKNFWMNNSMYLKCIRGAKLMLDNGEMDIEGFYKLCERHRNDFLPDEVTYSRIKKYVGGLRYDEFFKLVFGE